MDLNPYKSRIEQNAGVCESKIALYERRLKSLT